MDINSLDSAIAPRDGDRRPRVGPTLLHRTTSNVGNEAGNRIRHFTTEPEGAARSGGQQNQRGAMASFEPLIDSATAAELLRVHRKTLERMALRGELPGHKVGRFWRFRASELDEWLRSGVNSGRQPCCTTSF